MSDTGLPRLKEGLQQPPIFEDVVDPDSPEGKSTVAVPALNPVWSPPSEVQLQKMLKNCSVEGFVARGGMGAVYRGRQLSLDRPVAIKILPPHLYAADKSYAVRFENEAMAMAKLHHPAVIAVHDAGRMANDTLYLIMELVDGMDLAEMVATQGRLSPLLAITVGIQVCEALAAAHAAGILHRDIKPANILISISGEVKVGDFGLARLPSAEQQGLTRMGTVLGTYHYMAPECLVQGRLVDHRSDLYSLGVTLYQLLTAQLPQIGATLDPPSRWVSHITPQLDAVVLTAMQENPSYRHQSAKQMKEALQALIR